MYRIPYFSSSKLCLQRPYYNVLIQFILCLAMNGLSGSDCNATRGWLPFTRSVLETG